MPVLKTIEGNTVVRAGVVAATDPHGVIVTDRYDKVLFPERRVIVDDPLDREKMDCVLQTLALQVPVYLYSDMTEDAVAHMNRERLDAFFWEFDRSIAGRSLYRLEYHANL